jgi:arylsulfatase A-like enzyme
VPRNDPDFHKFVRGSKRSGKIDDRFTVSEAIEWIDGLGAEPFFIYMNLQNSHVPYEIPADFPVRFGTGKVSFPLQFGYFPPDSVDAVMDLYANSLAYVDAQIARLVRHLQAAGLWERTILVVTGDTGQAFFEHGFAGHANALYDEVMRVPLIVRSPDIESGVDGRLAQHVDVPPSVLHLIGLPPHPSFQGRDLFAEEGIEPAEDRHAFLVVQAAAHQYAIVDGRFKLIFDAGSGEHLLYDLQEDPAETEDVSDVRPADLRRLALRLHAWRKAQLDYYQNPMLHGDWYPPVLPDSLERSATSTGAG